MPAIIRVLLCLLAFAALAPATASATHWQQPDQPGQADPPWDEEQDDDGWDELDFEPAEDPGPPAEPGPPQPQPQPQPEPDPQPQPPGFDEDDWADDDGSDGWRPDPVLPPVPLVTTATVAGKVAMLRTDGKAAIPRGAPKRVKAIIAAANQIVGKRYKWGGGHAKLVDRGYDCSGTVSYALIVSRSGLLGSPLVSGSFARWGVAGAGRWVTVYANKGHVYMEVAGLRLDTSAVADPRGGKGPRWRPAIGKRPRFRVRHPLGL